MNDASLPNATPSTSATTPNQPQAPEPSSQAEPQKVSPNQAPSTASPNDATASYVDEYQPPASQANATLEESPASPAPSDVVSTQALEAPDEPQLPAEAGESAADGTPSVKSTDAVTPSSNDSTAGSQQLEDQNIFFLLGVEDGTDEEKEAFLDELQHVIWEDFLENDIELLVTAEELQQVKDIITKAGDNHDQAQEEVIQYLEKLIPDLEDIMLEKALELKEDMVKERLAGMKEYYAEDVQATQKLADAQTAMDAARWHDAATAMNAI